MAAAAHQPAVDRAIIIMDRGCWIFSKIENMQIDGATTRHNSQYNAIKIFSCNLHTNANDVVNGFVSNANACETTACD